jgi:hypothetical protein
MGIAAILQLLNIAIPNIVSVVTVIRNANGTNSAIFYLDQADSQFAQNSADLGAWLAAHSLPQAPAPKP